VRRATIAAILATSFLFATACGGDSDAEPEPSTPVPPTEVNVYEPEPPPAGVEPLEAMCFSESVAAAGRTDAWRCSVENSIYDPCFRLDERHLMCGPDPTTGDSGVYVVADAASLGTMSADRGAMPEDGAWLLALEDGTVCNFATGATGGNEEGRLNYACSNQEWVLGALIPGTTWLARFVTGAMGASGFEARTSEIRPIARVWR
jgi:hypothetical protein